MGSGRRWIAHLDMDAFYASVELLRYPDLRGRPVVIGGGRDHAPVERVDPASGAAARSYARLRDYAGRGVITTATYEARALGVGSAMGMMKAARLAPDAVLLPVDFDEYRRFSRLFKAAVRELAPQIEDRGIDEIYIDLTDLIEADGDGSKEAQRAHEVGGRIRRAVREATGLTCSMGVTPNKLLSKIASELNKPDGITVLTEPDIPERIWPLPARRISGIGPKSAAKLDALGIRTIGDLARADPALLVEQFGRSFGRWLHEAAHGRDDQPVITHSEPKSLSRETTFERDLHAVRDRAVLSAIFTDLCDALARDLQRKGYAGRTIGVKLRFEDFSTLTRERTVPVPLDEAGAIRRAAGECLKRVSLDRRIRLLGVRAVTLSRAAEIREPGAESGPDTRDLFETPGGGG